MAQADVTLRLAGESARARLAMSAGFFVFGLAWAIWAVHIPAIVLRLQLDPVLLGLALLGVGLGGVISQPLTGMLIARIGSQPAARLFLPLAVVAVLLPIVAWNVGTLFVGTFLLGAIAGAANVAINTQASEIQTALGTPVMSSFHGFFSLGALAGALAGSGIIALGRQDGSGALAVLAILLVTSIFIGSFFLPTMAAIRPEAKAKRGFRPPPLAVLGLAALCFLANMIEGAVNDWSALYLATVRDLPMNVAASGFAVFSLAMAVFRLVGGPVVARLGERRIVVLGGLLVAAGIAVVVLSPWAALSPFGFGLVAIGAANSLPVMISAASRVSGSASTGVAAAATGALLGFLIGPPAIGFVTHAYGLSVAIGLLMFVGIAIAGGAALFKWPPLVPANGVNKT
jgi:MFS family permease